MNIAKSVHPVVSKNLLALAVMMAVSPVLAQNLVLEEVVVTATKRAVGIQDISGTVNVVSGDAIDRLRTFDFKDIEQQTAGLTLSAPNARNNNISLRGMSTDPESGASAVVSVFWNDQPIRSDTAFGRIYDMERVEVLRGPQGTLQGRTSPGGSINLVTKGADLNEASGNIQASFSDNDGINGQFAYGGPLVDGVFAARVAGVYDINNSNDVSNITTGLNDPEDEVSSLRLSAAWQITDNLKSSFVYQYYDRDTERPAPLQGSDALGLRPTLNASDRVALGQSNEGATLEYDLYNLRFDWQLGNLDLVSVTGYSDSTKDSYQENDRANYVTLDGDPFSIDAAITNQNSLTKAETLSQEIRLSSSGNDFWDWMVGVFYLDQDTETAFASNRAVAPPLNISFSSVGAIPVTRDELAFFTFNQFYLSERLTLEAGLRWTEYDSYRAADVFYGDTNYLPEFLIPIQDIVVGGISGAFPIIGISDAYKNTKEDAVTGSLTLRYNWTEDTTVYAAYNRGYRPSGISINPTPAVQLLPNGEDDVLHDEETSNSFEFGFKGRYLDGRAALNGALYYQTFDGYFGFVRGVQVLDADGLPNAISGGLIYNGDAKIWGLELEGQILLSDRWSAGGALAYAKGEWDSGAQAPCNDREPGEVLGSCDIGGQSLGGEPEFSLSLQSEYFIPAGGNEWYLRGLYKYTDERDNTDASAGLGITRGSFEDFHILNVYAGLRRSDMQWDVGLWVKNLLDSDEVIYEQGPDDYDIPATGGSYTQTNILAERVIGVTARYNF